MHRSLIGAAALLVLCSGAGQAADYSSGYGGEQDWTGPYMGLTFGYALGESEHSITGGGSSDDFDVNGITGGAVAGYNHQIRNFIIGVEADISHVDLKDRVNVPFCTGFSGGCSTELEFLTTARARVGYLVDGIMPYITGGFAAGSVDAMADVLNLNSRMHYGWTAGGGLEWEVLSGVRARVEYLFTDLGTRGHEFPTSATPINVSLDNLHTIRGGLTVDLDAIASAAVNSVSSLDLPDNNDDGFTFKIGTRYWYSTGQTDFDLIRPDVPAMISRLTYSDLDAHSGEVFFRADYEGDGALNRFFVKGYVGAGGIPGGELVDEDFPPVVAPYSNTISTQEDGALTYASVDIGRTVVETESHRTGLFVGYHYWRENVHAMGCVQRAASGICVPTIADGVSIISQKSNWHSIRAGLVTDLRLNEFISLTAEGAYTYSWLDGQDSHHLRPTILPLPEDGGGHGMQFESVVNFQVHEMLELGVGLRYWRIFNTDGDAHFEQTPGGGFPQNAIFSAERYGVFVQGAVVF